MDTPVLPKRIIFPENPLYCVTESVVHTGFRPGHSPGPSFMQRALLSAARLAKILSNGFRSTVFSPQWFLAYNIVQEGMNRDTCSDLRYIVPPGDRYFADPFPVAVEGRYYIFLEEFLYEKRKAHISVIEMHRDGTWLEPLKILERDYHLSYPFIFLWKGEYFLLPETIGHRSIEVYRCVEFPIKWRFEKTLVDNIDAVDATLHQADDAWWMFVGVGRPGFPNDELHVFHSESPLGPWKPHNHNPVKSDVASARPAGRLFKMDGELYRPAQDCSVRYGYAITLNKIEKLTQDEFRETECIKLRPRLLKGLWGVHTWNRTEELTVMDCFRYKPKFLARAHWFGSNGR
ncbi:MAG TPA: hypothetical protein VK463_02655 [Desulfomonilaceae bacterium]|nr:hypothetical protein [Desulfomonilaceae bacterium]